jgi:regulator of cell morphogenesis and NO signaling
MSAFDPTDAVGSVVAAVPATSEVFERHGIDVDAERGVSVGDACRARGLDVSDLLAALERALSGSPTGLSAVIDHIVGRHHAFAKREMPRIGVLMDHALRVHGARHPNLFPVLTGLWRRFAQEFETHMRQEEDVLFPAIRAAEGGRTSGFRCGNLDAPVLRAEWMHDEQWEELAQMRRVGGGYVPPAGADETWEALYVALDAFERDLHEHVHIENDVLFPRVRALDLRRSGASTLR